MEGGEIVFLFIVTTWTVQIYKEILRDIRCSETLLFVLKKNVLCLSKFIFIYIFI